MMISDSTVARRAGFTLIEVVVVLAVMGILLGAAAPLAGALIDAERRTEVTRELRALGVALEAYYEQNAAFPAALTDSGFYGTYLQPGVNGAAVLDAWGGGQAYVYAVSGSPDVARVHSVGEDGVDQAYANEELRIEVFGAAPGLRTTRDRMRVILQALAVFVEGGGTLTGTWATDRAAMGLGADYELDGFGTAFRLGVDFVLESAGPDRAFGTADDVGT